MTDDADLVSLLVERESLRGTIKSLQIEVAHLRGGLVRALDWAECDLATREDPNGGYQLRVDTLIAFLHGKKP
jgi:hypothetical protein